MRKVIFLGISSLIISLLIISCEKDLNLRNQDELSITNRDVNSVEELTDYNNFALVVSEALRENIEFRQKVKSEALLKFDGDYDILLKNFKESFVEINHNQVTIKDFLNRYYNKLGLSVNYLGDWIGNDGTNNETINNNNNDANNNIEKLVKKYPLIQISVPVNINVWNSNYNPIVASVPSSYNEGDPYVTGYQDGNSIQVDAINEPDHPVVVIGNNERTLEHYPITTDPPNVTIVLQGSTFEYGIRLNWTISDMTQDISDYYIYRKYTENQFKLIGTSVSKFNTTYNDYSVTPNASYVYYVVASNSAGQSLPSNLITVTAPSMPNVVESLKASHTEEGRVELRWTHKYGQYVSGTTLYRRVVGEEPVYKYLADFPPNVSEYIDTNVPKGKKIFYKAVNHNYLGDSDPLYDFVIIPYRDVANPSPVRMKRISLTDLNPVEGWLRGAPEFRISVTKGTSSSSASIVQEEIICEFKSRTLDDYFNKLVSNWLPSDWMEIFTFKVVEIDGGPDLDLTINTGFNKKDSTQTQFINGSIDLKIEDMLDKKDEIVGNGELRYTDTKEYEIEFSNQSGFKLLLSDH